MKIDVLTIAKDRRHLLEQHASMCLDYLLGKTAFTEKFHAKKKIFLAIEGRLKSYYEKWQEA